jgi:hypothetical protein
LEDLTVVDIFIGTNKSLALREAISDAVDSGQYGSLPDDIRDAFTADQIDQIEELLDSGDFDEFLETLLSDWSGDSTEDLITEMKEGLAEIDIELTVDDEVDASDDIDFEDEEFEEEEEEEEFEEEEEIEDEDEEEEEEEEE